MRRGGDLAKVALTPHPDGDGNNKLDHVAQMLEGAIYSKQLAFTHVLMDSWYATQKLMAQIDRLGKVYYCPLKVNRRVDDSGGVQPYQRIEQLNRTPATVEFHREIRQLTGVEACQCRQARIQRNHIACALLVWTRLKTIAYQTDRTIYQIKHGLLSDYLMQQLKYPSVPMLLA